MPEETPDLPITRLGDVEKNSTLIRVPYYIENVDWANKYRYDWSLLAPLQLQADEQGTVSEPGKGKYTTNIHTLSYKLAFPFMREGVISGLIKKNRMRVQGQELKRITNPAFEILIVREDMSVKEIYAAKGKGVIYIKYLGSAGMDTLLKTVEEKMSLLSL